MLARSADMFWYGPPWGMEMGEEEDEEDGGREEGEGGEGGG